MTNVGQSESLSSTIGCLWLPLVQGGWVADPRFTRGNNFLPPVDMSPALWQCTSVSAVDGMAATIDNAINNLVFSPQREVAVMLRSF